jgi:hypothetical protein
MTRLLAVAICMLATAGGAAADCPWAQMTKLCGATLAAARGQCITCVLKHAALADCVDEIEGFCSGNAGPTSHGP